MKLSILIPVFDDLQEAASMIEAVRTTFTSPFDLEFLVCDLRGDWSDRIKTLDGASALRGFQAPSLPAAKNRSAKLATGEYLMFLFPGIFPTTGAIDALVRHLQHDPAVSAVAGRWCNSSGKLEVGYNIRRFPTFLALSLDLLLLNKVFPHNGVTRSFKMHDFDHNQTIYADHANDCVFMARKPAIEGHGGFNESYAPGWFDQVEFCQSLTKAGRRIGFEPNAKFVSNEKVPLIDRLVEDQYLAYRRAENIYIHNHFGRYAAALARVLLIIGMAQRIGFTLLLPAAMRGWLLAALRSYVGDEYVRSLRRVYWTVLKKTVRGDLWTT